MRIAHRWDAIQDDTDAKEDAKVQGKTYSPIVLENGDTRKRLLARGRYLLFKSADKWTESRRQRAKVLFKIYPDLKEAYSLTHSLRMIFSKNTDKDAAMLSLARWYTSVPFVSPDISVNCFDADAWLAFPAKMSDNLCRRPLFFRHPGAYKITQF